ncbi:hypothetical protein [Meiothermus granaticius]|uniref:Uncharacterized protein n=1 Tax=Meiothermus granaticius NBRC 107808 TaxID=1227551 RepID=A0A399FDW2_9DEIN|nr:hypothetical protein [Meiothermus granaticius]RIH94016.1 hypothetical protein Mgrana_00102 [Meiothermus granaticius NBRC 107808]GEM88155.1 hypothetical protein MGR01S_27800 [Meiothermus granaticius NBRC 107808]
MKDAQVFSFGKCHFCGHALERTTPAGHTYRAPVDDCCAARTLYLLGSLMQYTANSVSAGKPHDPLEEEIVRLNGLLRRQIQANPDVLETARRAVVEHNKQGGQWFDMGQVIGQIRKATPQGR